MIERFKDWLAERRIRRLARRLAIAYTERGPKHPITLRTYAALTAACLARSSAQVARMHLEILAKAGK